MDSLTLNTTTAYDFCIFEVNGPSNSNRQNLTTSAPLHTTRQSRMFQRNVAFWITRNSPELIECVSPELRHQIIIHHEGLTHIVTLWLTRQQPQLKSFPSKFFFQETPSSQLLPELDLFPLHPSSSTTFCDNRNTHQTHRTAANCNRYPLWLNKNHNSIILSLYHPHNIFIPFFLLFVTI